MKKKLFVIGIGVVVAVSGIRANDSSTDDMLQKIHNLYCYTAKKGLLNEVAALLHIVQKDDSSIENLDRFFDEMNYLKGYCENTNSFISLDEVEKYLNAVKEIKNKAVEPMISASLEDDANTSEKVVEVTTSEIAQEQVLSDDSKKDEEVKQEEVALVQNNVQEEAQQ